MPAYPDTRIARNGVRSCIASYPDTQLGGFAFERPTGATLPRDTLLLNSPRTPTGGGGGKQPSRRSRVRSTQTGQFCPPQNFGAKLSRNKQQRERSDPPLGDGSASGVPAWMLARCLPVAVSCISGRKGAVGRRVATEAKRSLRARDGVAGMPEGASRKARRAGGYSATGGNVPFDRKSRRIYSSIILCIIVVRNRDKTGSAREFRSSSLALASVSASSWANCSGVSDFR